MIKNKEIAKEISELMLTFGDKLDHSASIVRESCPKEEFENYRNAIAKILAEMLLEVMNPLYKEHPGIKPEQLK